MSFKKFDRVIAGQFRPVTKMDVDHFKKTGSIYPEDSATQVAIGDFSLALGCPKVGDMIGRDPNKHTSQWLLSEEYFNEYYKLAQK